MEEGSSCGAAGSPVAVKSLKCLGTEMSVDECSSERVDDMSVSQLLPSLWAETASCGWLDQQVHQPCPKRPDACSHGLCLDSRVLACCLWATQGQQAAGCQSQEACSWQTWLALVQRCPCPMSRRRVLCARGVRAFVLFWTSDWKYRKLPKPEPYGVRAVLRCAETNVAVEDRATQPSDVRTRRWRRCRLMRRYRLSLWNI